MSKDPLEGTGKKPKKGQEGDYIPMKKPKDTVSIKFATVADAEATVRKVKRVNKPFARKIQILTVLEQRAKVQTNRQAQIARAAKEDLRVQK